MNELCTIQWDMGKMNNFEVACQLVPGLEFHWAQEQLTAFELLLKIGVHEVPM